MESTICVGGVAAEVVEPTAVKQILRVISCPPCPFVFIVMVSLTYKGSARKIETEAIPPFVVAEGEIRLP